MQSRPRAAGAILAAASALLLFSMPAAPSARQVLSAPLIAPAAVGPVNATVGQPFMLSLCGGVVPRQFDRRASAFTALCMPPPGSTPAGGSPPYSFWTEFGFPPFGIYVHKNGMISGVPRAAGIVTFPVVVRDLGGRQTRIAVTINVQPRPPAPPGAQLPPLPPPEPPPGEAASGNPPATVPLLRQPDRGGPYVAPCSDAAVLKARADIDYLSRGLHVQQLAMARLRQQIESAKNASRDARRQLQEQFRDFAFGELKELAKSFIEMKDAVDASLEGLTLSMDAVEELRQLNLIEADWLRFVNSSAPAQPVDPAATIGRMTRDTNALWRIIEKRAFDPAGEALTKRLAGSLGGTVWNTAKLALENAITTELMFDSQLEYIELQNSYDAIKWHYDRVHERILDMQQYVSDCPEPQQVARPAAAPAPPSPPVQKRPPARAPEKPEQQQSVSGPSTTGLMLGLLTASGVLGYYAYKELACGPAPVIPDSCLSFRTRDSASCRAAQDEYETWCTCQGGSFSVSTGSCSR